MKPIRMAIALLALPGIAAADPMDRVIDDTIDMHILPRFAALNDLTQTLADVAAEDCDPDAVALRSAYGDAFDAWISASHLRFGPTEANDRAFALAFWPDSRGATPRALKSLIAEQDPVVASADAFRQVSIAARGFYAMEFLLFDDTLKQAGDPQYHCNLIQTMSTDIALTSHNIFEEWQSEFAITLREPLPAGVYRSNDEVLQELFKALATGLQFTADTRLGRPLGTFDRPRPTRSEARRSERSARHVMLSLTALRDLSEILARGDTKLMTSLDASFQRALSQLSELDDPTFASVSNPQARFKVEVIQNSIEAIRTIVRDELGPKLGVAAGFNALDGD